MFRLGLFALATLALVLAVVQVDAESWPNTENIVTLSQRLEHLAVGSRRTSPVTWDLIEAAVKEFKDLPRDVVEEIDSQGVGQMVLDFAIIPVIQLEDLIVEEDEKEFFIERLVKEYTFFRGAYILHELIGQPIELPNRPKLDRVMKAAQNKDNRPLTIDDFYAVQQELDAYVQAINSIRRQEDIYSRLDELRKIWNLINYSALTLLRENILPRLRRDQNPEVLREMYSRLLAKEGYVVLPRGSNVQQEKPKYDKETEEKTLANLGSVLDNVKA